MAEYGPTNTRPAVFDERQAADLLRQLQTVLNKSGDRGAQVSVQDPRFTSTMYWFLGVIATSILGGFAWQLSTLSDLREQNATLIANVAEMQRINVAQDSRLNAYDDRIRLLERSIKWKP